MATLATHPRDSVPNGPEVFRAEWHRVVGRKDLASLPKLPAEDVSLGSPPYWERFEGREVVAFLLGDRFQGRVLPDDSALPGTPMAPHSVVTLHLIDREGEPTRAVLDEILAFFGRRLAG